jgi:2-oxoglutarate dehydrogenase E1 component
MSPKSLLRHPGAVSTLADLTDGSFRLVIDDPSAPAAESVRRVILGTGKIFYALDAARRQQARADVALVRIEQLYPFPRVELREALARYPAAREVFWVQEEPANQGAWWFVLPLISPLLRAETRFSYVGRAEAASPATGNHDIHQAEEAAILEQALAG